MKRSLCAQDRHGTDLSVNAHMTGKPSCANTTSDFEEFAAIADRPRDCEHDHFRVDFKRSGRQDNMLGQCRFHSECAVGCARNAEIRECRKLKWTERNSAVRKTPRGRAIAKKAHTKRELNECANIPKDTLYLPVLIGTAAHRHASSASNQSASQPLFRRSENYAR